MLSRRVKFICSSSNALFPAMRDQRVSIISSSSARAPLQSVRNLAHVLTCATCFQGTPLGMHASNFPWMVIHGVSIRTLLCSINAASAISTLDRHPNIVHDAHCSTEVPLDMHYNRGELGEQPMRNLVFTGVRYCIEPFELTVSLNHSNVVQLTHPSSFGHQYLQQRTRQGSTYEGTGFEIQLPLISIPFLTIDS